MNEVQSKVETVQLLLKFCYQVVLYSKDHKDLGVAHEKTSPKSQPYFSLMTMKQYWLAQTSLQINAKHFHQVAMIFFLIIKWNSLVTN